MNRIERVVVDECVGQESPLVGQLCERLGERPVKFVFLATEHPGIPDIEILDKLLHVRSALLTQDRVLHNLAIGRGFQSFVHTPESGLTDGDPPSPAFGSVCSDHLQSAMSRVTSGPTLTI
jgi:hypothetical protein